jgi:hypothetical protein
MPEAAFLFSKHVGYRPVEELGLESEYLSEGFHQVVRGKGLLAFLA